MAAEKVPIRPAVLEWALAEAGETPESLGSGIKVPTELVENWLSGDDRPGTSQFRDLAAYLKRPTSVLLLKQPPEGGVPASFRHPPGSSAGRTITREEAQAVRAARRVQSVAKWIGERAEDVGPPPNLPDIVPMSDPANAARELASWLSWSVALQTSSKSQYEALNEMRTRLEDKRVLVLHLRMGRDGCRGFSLPDDQWPLIAVSRRYIPPARMFTYVHELVHLASHTQSMCLTGAVAASELERWCEEVAGNFLLPFEEAKRFLENELGIDTARTPAHVARIARRFWLSQRGTAYRLQLAGLGVGNLYEQVHASTDLPPATDDDSGPRERRAVRQVRELGAAFSGLVVRAEDRRLLSRHDVIEYLDLPASQLDEWRTLARGASTAA